MLHHGQFLVLARRVERLVGLPGVTPIYRRISCNAFKPTLLQFLRLPRNVLKGTRVPCNRYPCNNPPPSRRALRPSALHLVPPAIAPKMGLDRASDSPLRVLSIQSHVVSGYVGNKAAVFPLQLLGYDVDVLPSVTLANHTGYTNGAAGIRHTAEEVSVWIEGLRVNGLLAGITHLLTGYIGTASALTAVVDAVHLLRKEATDQLVFVCDPVLGDDGKLYVDEDVVQLYIARVLPLATLLTPNAFELGLLTSRKIGTREEAFAACDFLHDKYGIPTVVVTGTRFESGSDTVAVLVSAWRDKQDPQSFALEAEYIEGSFTGSGDLLTALLLAWTSRLPHDLVSACRNAMASVTALLKRTVVAPRGKGLTDKPELKLVQGQDEILMPPVELIAVKTV